MLPPSRWISELANSINVDVLTRKINLLNSTLIKDFRILKPKIAVLGLNPHAGELGLLGGEEKKYIIPAIKNAKNNNIAVIIAGAGGSAHLPGMISALTSIPVLGVPIESRKLKGIDSLLSIVQMPKGIPVGTLAIGKDGAINTALLAASIIAISDNKIKKKLDSWRLSQSRSVKKKT